MSTKFYALEPEVYGLPSDGPEVMYEQSKRNLSRIIQQKKQIFLRYCTPTAMLRKKIVQKLCMSTKLILMKATQNYNDITALWDALQLVKIIAKITGCKL